MNFGDIMQIKLIDSRDYYRHEEDEDGFMEFWFDDEMLEKDMESLFNKEGEFVTLGWTGRWDGKHSTIFLEPFCTLKDAIEATFLNGQFEYEVGVDCSVNLRSYYDYIQGVFDPRNELWVYGHHHDGTNMFKIMELTEKGHEMYQELYTTVDEVVEVVGTCKEVDFFKSD